MRPANEWLLKIPVSDEEPMNLSIWRGRALLRKSLLLRVLAVAFLAVAVHVALLVEVLLLVLAGKLASAHFAGKIVVVHSSTPRPGSISPLGRQLHSWSQPDFSAKK